MVRRLDQDEICLYPCDSNSLSANLAVAGCTAFDEVSSTGNTHSSEMVCDAEAHLLEKVVPHQPTPRLSYTLVLRRSKLDSVLAPCPSCRSPGVVHSPR